MDVLTNRSLAAAALSTLALFAAQPGPPQSSITWCEEVDAPYLFVPGDVTAVDGVTSIAPTGGTAGRWLLGSDRVSIATTGGAQNVRLNTIIAACGGKARVAFRANTFVIAAPVFVTANTVIDGHPGTNLASTMANGTGTSNCVLVAAPHTTGAAVALSANPVVGSEVLAVVDTASFPVGTEITIGRGNRWTEYVVRARSVASGAGNLTVERPVLWSFVFNGGTPDSVYPITSAVVRNVKIHGNGMTISGTGDRAIEMTGVIDCLIDDITIDATAGFNGVIASFDIGGLRCAMRDVRVIGGNTAQGGIGRESGESMLIDHCSVLHATSTGGVVPGYFDSDCMASWTRNSIGSKNGVGYEFNYGGAPGEGTRRSGMVGCTFESNGNHGIQVLNGAKDIQIEATHSRYNGGNGVYLTNSASGIQLIGVNASFNSQNGVQIAAGSSAGLTECVLSDNAVTGIDTGGDCTIVGGSIERNLAYEGVLISGAANVQISTTRFASVVTNGVVQACCHMVSTGELRLSGCLLTITGTGTKIGIQHAGAGTVYLEGVRTTGGTHGYLSSDATSTLYCGNAVDFSASGTPFSFTKTPNFGTFTLNGVTQVDVAGAFPVGATIAWSIATVGGTPGTASPYFSAANTAGHFFVKSPTANANDVYNWKATW